MGYFRRVFRSQLSSHIKKGFLDCFNFLSGDTLEKSHISVLLRYGKGCRRGDREREEQLKEEIEHENGE